MSNTFTGNDRQNPSNRHLQADDIAWYSRNISQDMQSELENERLEKLAAHLRSCSKCRETLGLFSEVYLQPVGAYQQRTRLRSQLVVAMMLVAAFTAGWLQLRKTPAILPQSAVTQTQQDTSSLHAVQEPPESPEPLANKPAPEEPVLTTTRQTPQYKPVVGKKALSLEQLLADYQHRVSQGEEILLASLAAGRGISLPDGFAEDPLQEERLRSAVTRSGGRAILLTPQRAAVVSNQPQFSWQPTTGSITIIVKDNQNRKAWEGEARGDHALAGPDNLASGRYYWDLRVNGRMLAKSSFFVNRQ